MTDTDNVMEKIVSLSKRRGFIFPGSEIYGGLAGASVVADFSESFRDAPDPRETRKASFKSTTGAGGLQLFGMRELAVARAFAADVARVGGRLELVCKRRWPINHNPARLGR